jgi:FtsP/CotA-like multicopper oxidase with cupredoxin domain
MMKTPLRIHVFAAIFIAVSQIAFSAESHQPADWDSQLKLREAVDLNPDPRIVELNLRAQMARVHYAPGQTVEAWTYDGGIPGPLIRARVGDRLIVHFRNDLPKPTTVHWHGVRLPIEMDGVPGISQPEVKPGESFTYDFVLPDAGLYWYHPHVMSAFQVGFGLYGPLLVEDPDEEIGVQDELVLVLSDIAVENKGTLMDRASAGGFRLVFGLEGNHVLVNGRNRPTLKARAGAPQRWRIVNAATTRYFFLEMGTNFTVIGRDGGLQEYPTEHETLVIAPGERIDTIVAPRGTAGSELIVRTFPYNRGYGSQYLPLEDLFTIAFNEAPPLKVAVRPTIRRSIQPMDTVDATPITLDLTLVQGNDKSVEYRINNVPASKLKPIQARLGETQIWNITNQTDWSHPMHLHGFFFQVLDKNGEPVRPLAWRDTVDVPFKETRSFIVKYDKTGSWMYHCHVLDHADGGLMSAVDVGVEHPSKHSH